MILGKPEMPRVYFLLSGEFEEGFVNRTWESSGQNIHRNVKISSGLAFMAIFWPVYLVEHFHGVHQFPQVS